MVIEEITMSSLVAALLYTRVSDEDQADADTLASLGRTKKKGARNGLSLATQLAEVRRYVSYQPDWVIQEEFKDVLSGKRSDRPDYQRLLADAKLLRAQGRRVAVVVAALDRFGRSVRERVECWEALTPLGVEFHSVREGGLQQEWMYNLLAGLAQEESRRLGERVTKVRDGLREQGWKAPGRAAWGYAWRRSTEDEQRMGAPESVLVPDDATAKYASEAWERAAGGESVRSVTRWIVSLPAEARGGRRMTYRGVQLMLRAPVYVARPDEGDEDVLARPSARWEPLVSDETWNVVQEQLARHAKRGRRASGKYLLSGFLCCPCGQRMHGGASPGGKRRKDGTKGTWNLYRCERATVGVTDDGIARCRLQLSAKLVDDLVIERVAPVLALASAEPRVRAALARGWRELQQAQAPDPSLRVRLGQLERAAQKARQRLKNAALMLVDGALDRQGYQDVKQQAEHDLVGAEQEIERLRGAPTTPSLPDLETALQQLSDLATLWRDGDMATRRKALGELVKRITPCKVGRGQYDAEVQWSPLVTALRGVAERAA